MKILAIRLARSIWLIPPYFLNPKGVFIRPSLEALKERYKFQKSPFESPAPIPNPKDGAKYENGAFSVEDETVMITSATIHDDGFVVDTRSSTAHGDAFLDDALSWIAQKHGLPIPTELPITKLYASELNVIFDKAPQFLDPKLAPFLKEVSSAISDEKTGKADFLSFQFSTDPTVHPRQDTFRIDREINAPFEQNRYYSFATTTTDVHLKLLKKLESLL